LATRQKKPLASKTVQTLKPYDAVSSLEKMKHLEGGLSPLKLDWNEATISPSPKVLRALLDFLNGSLHLNYYPELGAPKVREALEKRIGVPAQNILVTNGSDDALDLLCRTFVDPQDEVVVPAPTYGHFLIFAQSRGAVIKKVMALDVFSSPVPVLLKSLTQGTKMVYLASPNNPTGVVIEPEDVRLLCNRYPSTLFVVDEAYWDFCGVTSVRLAVEFENLVVTRTFSKCFGLAGLRIGYLVSHQSVLEELKKLYNPKSVNALAQVAAVAALEDEEHVANYARLVREGMEVLAKGLEARGARVARTRANFLLVKVQDPKKLCSALEEVGVFVRDRSHMEGFEGFVRFTVGTPEQMKEVLERIDILLERYKDLLK
jgi:histidinol-phosphate aminotransferase